MEDAAFVRRGKAGADLSNNLDCVVRRETADAAQQRREVFAVHVLHRHERTAVPFADVMNPTDIGMRNLAGRAGLVAQARRQGGLVAAQKLQRNRLAECEIVGAIDLAHPASTQQADDAVARRQEGARRERAVIDPAASSLRTVRGVRRLDWVRRRGRGDGRRFGGCAAYAACHGVGPSYVAADGADHRAHLVIGRACEKMRDLPSSARHTCCGFSLCGQERRRWRKRTDGTNPGTEVARGATPHDPRS